MITIPSIFGHAVAFIEGLDDIEIDAEWIPRNVALSAVLVREAIYANAKIKALALGVPIIPISSLDYDQFDDIIIVDIISLKDVINAARSELSHEQEQDQPKKVKELFEEYRKERQKETLRRV